MFDSLLLYLPPYSPDFNPYAFGGAKPYFIVVLYSDLLTDVMTD